MRFPRLSFEALPRPLKRLIKLGIPKSILLKRRNRRLMVMNGKSNSEIFSATYNNFLWGRKSNDFKFYSGDGSHLPEIVNDYIANVSNFLSSFEAKPSVVDIGCGDFNIGSQLAHLTSEYIACDVVTSVIEQNRKLFMIENVKFLVVDAVVQELPKGDVVILRQVLQHLSNQDVTSIIRKVEKIYEYLIFTDHQPFERDWIPNIDKLTGPNIRVEFGSGLDLAQPPFNLEFHQFELISEVRNIDGYIRTFVFRLGSK